MKISMFLAAAAATAITVSAMAATPAGVTPGANNRVYANQSSGHYTPPLAHKKNLPAIFANFATLYPRGVYNASTGASLSGPATLHGQSWLAAAFTPAAAATVKEIDVAASFVIGSKDKVLVHIYADASGVPGAELWSHKATLPTFGDCCAIVALSDKDNVKLTAGTQYWVGITTLPGAQDTMAAWNLNVFDQVDAGTMAVDRGTGWQAVQALPQLAFGVYGK